MWDELRRLHGGDGMRFMSRVSMDGPLTLSLSPYSSMSFLLKSPFILTFPFHIPSSFLSPFTMPFLSSPPFRFCFVSYNFPGIQLH